MSSRRRLAGVSVLLAALVGLCIWYGTLAPAPALGDYPENADIVENYGGYVGEQATISGPVQSLDPVTLVVKGLDGTTHRLTIHGAPTSVQRGDKLRVFGVVEPGFTIRATNVIIVPAGNLWYTWLVSLGAGLWVFGRVLRHWRLDTTTLSLAPRERAVSFWNFLRSEQ